MQIVIGEDYTTGICMSASWASELECSCKISKETFKELLLWDSSCCKINEKGIDITKVNACGNFGSDFDVFCDASDVGFGGYFCTQTDAIIEETSGNWTKHEKQKSLTWRKLECVRKVLQTYEDC